MKKVLDETEADLQSMTEKYIKLAPKAKVIYQEFKASLKRTLEMIYY